jgi:DNA repair exonuclease SbcCD ATPase subunit
MFEALRQAFREAIANFHAELNENPQAIPSGRLTSALAEAQRRLSALESEIEVVREEARQEVEALEACVRREALAGRIGDAETQRIARAFAERHERRRDLLERKAAILASELDDRAQELSELMRGVQSPAPSVPDAPPSKDPTRP